MSDEELKAFIELARLYGKARIDLQILSAMLMRAQGDQIPPIDWLSDLERMRELPGNRAALEELERLLQRAEQERNQSELLRLLKNLPGSGQVH